MYAFKFAKIDMFKSKSLVIMAIFPVIAFFLCIRSANENAMFAVSYCLFGSVVMASIPFQIEKAHEAGFIQMLPARPGDSVRGHFLYALGCILYGLAVGMLAETAGRLVNPAAAAANMAQFQFQQTLPVIGSLALLITALQSLLLSLFRFDSVRGMQLLRMVPAFVFFFGINYLSDHKQLAAAALRLLQGPGIWILPVICFAVFLICMEAAVRLWDR